MKKTAKKSKSRYVLVGNSHYGLYFGKTSDSDESISKSKKIRMTECRHVFLWYGGHGGITSLAAMGPCGTRMTESKIGAPCDALLMDIVNVFDCTEACVSAFATISVKQ